MMDSLFEKRNANGDDDDDDDELILRAGHSLDDLVDQASSWPDFYSFVGDKVLFTSPNCHVVQKDPLPDYEYTVDLIIVPEEENDADDATKKMTKKQKLEICAHTAQETEATINALLKICCKKSDDSSQRRRSITLKCFATNPRKVLATLAPLPESCRDVVSHLSVQFVTLDHATVQAILGSGLESVELKQCTIVDTGLEEALANSSGPTKLSLSMGAVEFAKLPPGLKVTTVQEMDLLLHFWLQGEAFEAFCDALSQNSGLTKLNLEYLDINDDGWERLTKALHNHPTLTSVTLAFTEKFVDTFRKLNPERRTARTQAILDLVKANSTIRELHWPEFQQDEELMKEVNALLESRKK